MAQPFTAASHHDILVLLVQLAVLLFTARILGEIAARLGQPTVVGEILAGVLLGPSFLSSLVPALGDWIVPHTPVQGYLLELVSLLGAMFLLLITGLETDIALIKRQARSAFGVAIGGLLLPLVVGFALGQIIPDSLLVSPENRLVFAMFLAIALAISAIPVIAKVLMDLNLMRRDVGQTIIAAAMIDDTTGWILLSVVIGLASSGVITAAGVAQSVLSVVAFLFISFTAGRLLIRWLLDFTQKRLQIRDRFLTLVVLAMFVWGAVAQALNLEALLGAFVVGILFSMMPRLHGDVVHTIESIAVAIFAPIFFATAGLKVNVLQLLQPDLLLIGIVLIFAAVFCKVVGVYIGARLIGGSDHWTALFFGAGLNARGSMGIIVATIGLTLNVLTQAMFSLTVVMAVFTSLIAPAMMRWALAHIQPNAEEEQRLRKEAMIRGSLIANVQRVLVPVRPRPTGLTNAAQVIEGTILRRLAEKHDLELTLLTITDTNGRTTQSEFLNRVAGFFPLSTVNKKVVVSERVQGAVLDEAKRDYDLMILGATEGRAQGDILFTPLVDELVRLAPCPTLIVRAQAVAPDWQPRRILVPTNGSLASQRAAEVAFAIASHEDEEVLFLRVVEGRASTMIYPDASGTFTARQYRMAQDTVEGLAQMGIMEGVATQTDVKIDPIPERAILNAAEEQGVDLIVLGTSVRAASERLHLGPRVERILRDAPCPVVIFNS